LNHKNYSSDNGTTLFPKKLIRTGLKSVEKLIDAFEKVEVLSSKNVTIIKMLAEKLGITELYRDKVDNFERNHRGEVLLITGSRASRKSRDIS
jgi:hypothetical protein